MGRVRKVLAGDPTPAPTRHIGCNIINSLYKEKCMSYIKDVFGRDLQMFDKFLVGFDDQWKNLAKLRDDVTKNLSNYPPYNIKKIDDTKYVIEVAVAGFAKSDLKITCEESKLTIVGSVDHGDTSEEIDYLYKGIGARDFSRTFVLNDQVEVKFAKVTNGILEIALERIVPDHKKPKVIEIQDLILNRQQLKNNS